MRKTLALAVHALAVSAAVVVLLNGCASSTATSAPTTASAPPSSSTPVPTVPSTSSPSTSSPTSAAPTATAAPSTDPDAPADQCADSALTVAITGGEAGAGSIEYAVSFTNTGSTDCALEGAPGVSVVGKGNGSQLGVPATRGGTANASTVALAPGAAASADLKVVNIGINGGPIGASCKVATGDGYRVYPPHSFAAVFVSMPKTPACTSSESWMTIGPVHAAS